MALARTAYIDESLRVRDGIYILAAVIIADTDADHYRQALTSLLHRRQARLHWRDESRTRRTQIVGAVRHLRHTGAIVIGTGMPPGHQERARRKCIERLLYELASRGIAGAVFERRHAELDARDRTMIAALHRQQIAARCIPGGVAPRDQRAAAVAARHRGRGRVPRRDRRRRLLEAPGHSVHRRPIHPHLTPDSAKPRLPSSGGPPGLTSSTPGRADVQSLPGGRPGKHFGWLPYRGHLARNGQSSGRAPFQTCSKLAR